MNKTAKIATISIVVAALVAPSVAAFAATPTVGWSNDHSMSTEDFMLGLGYAPNADALASANAVKVVSFGATSPSGGNFHELSTYRPAITATQNALAASPADVALLDAHNIPVDSVLAIDAGGNGQVTVYVR